MCDLGSIPRRPALLLPFHCTLSPRTVTTFFSSSHELIAGRGNGLVKIITGVRRCGKSFLLFDIWHNWLLEHGVTDNHIIEIQLDDFRNRRLRKPDALLDYIDSKVVDDGKPYYIVLDEVQLVEEFVEVILSLTHMKNVDVYVSGSNSRFLSSDVVTEFRGRGDEIRIWPLTFDEYFSGIGGDIRKAWLDYYTFGCHRDRSLTSSYQLNLRFPNKMSMVKS